MDENIDPSELPEEEQWKLSAKITDIEEYRKYLKKEKVVRIKEVFEIAIPFAVYYIGIIYITFLDPTHNRVSAGKSSSLWDVSILLICPVLLFVLLFLRGAILNHRTEKINRIYKSFAELNGLSFEPNKQHLLKAGGASGIIHGKYRGFYIQLFSNIGSFFLKSEETILHGPFINVGNSRICVSRARENKYLPGNMYLYAKSPMPERRIGSYENIFRKLRIFSSSDKFAEEILGEEILRKIDNAKVNFYLGQDKIMFGWGKTESVEDLKNKFDAYASVADEIKKQKN